MSSISLKIITTDDGSHSLLREDLNETYHSSHGALGESQHVFIQYGLRYYRVQHPEAKSIRILEVGFGTGLNAWLAAKEGNAKQVMEFHSLEPFPVPAEIYQHLNFGDLPEEKALLQKLHDAKWEEPVFMDSHFLVCKYETTLEDFKSDTRFHLIFFDAFAPSKQPDVWQMANIQKCYELLEPGGVLTTYCSQGQFKRNLSAAGFHVETLGGAMGKREMVRATRPLS